MVDPIRIPCEGSHHPVNQPIGGENTKTIVTFGLCRMCGELVPTVLKERGGAQGRRGWLAHQHDRNDVLAMLDRGDYD